jgi:hypothetical protein
MSGVTIAKPKVSGPSPKPDLRGTIETFDLDLECYSGALE